MEPGYHERERVGEREGKRFVDGVEKREIGESV